MIILLESKMSSDHEWTYHGLGGMWPAACGFRHTPLTDEQL